jgi:hypothetical protein
LRKNSDFDFLLSDFDFVLKGRGFSRAVTVAKSMAALAAEGSRVTRLFPQPASGIPQMLRHKSAFRR